MERRRIERNKREQNRVKQLRKAFQELQELLPNYQKTACTKAQILKDASVYIRYLKLKLQNVEEIKRTQGPADNCQARPSCIFATEGQEVSYLTHPVQSQSSVSLAASPSNYEACQEIDHTSSLTAPIWFVSNIRHSDTEDINWARIRNTASIAHGNDHQKGRETGARSSFPGFESYWSLLP